jgi:peptidoglycan-N-acetylglucosamine deacetylase
LSLLTLLSFLLLGLLFGRILVFMTLSARQYRRHRCQPAQPLKKRPLVSIVVPCFNEELVIGNCVLSLQRQSYANIEILLVNDGSTDDTALVAEQLEASYANVRTLTKENGGKATALNYGIQHAHGSVVVCMDADSMFLPHTVEQLARSIQEPGVAAVAGNVRVANRSNALGKHQAVEYITGLTIQGQTFAHLRCMQVISGAIGAFDRHALVEIGGYSSDTIVEDMDITITLSRYGHRVVYNPDAIAYTEAPETIREFFKQRYRWTYGRFQVIAKHRDMLYNREHQRMGAIGLPYYALFPWFDVTISVLLVAAILRVSVTGNGVPFLLLYAGMCLIQAVVISYALIIDRENRKLAVLAAIEGLFYNHLIAFTTLWAGMNYVRGREVRWNKLRRRGKNTLDSKAQARVHRHESRMQVQHHEEYLA